MIYYCSRLKRTLGQWRGEWWEPRAKVNFDIPIIWWTRGFDKKKRLPSQFLRRPVECARGQIDNFKDFTVKKG